MTTTVWIRGFIALVIGLLAMLVVGLLPVTLPATDNIEVPGPTTTLLPGAPPPNANLDEPQFGMVGPLYAGLIVRQQFAVTAEKIDAIALLFTTNHGTNRNTVQVGVDANVSGQWQSLATRVIEKQSLQDNAYSTLTFSPPLVAAKGQTLRITVRSEGSPLDEIALAKNAGYRPPGYLLTINNQRDDGTLRFRVGYTPRTGRLFAMIEPLWGRFTLFLTPFWRVVLALGFGVLIASFLVIPRVMAE